MRLPEFMLLLCLLSWAFVGSDAMGRMNMMLLAAIDGAPNRSSNQALEAASKRNSKRLNIRSEHSSKYEKYNDTSADDKRMVPTGPNPLHNR